MSSFLAPRRALRLRRFAVLRILLRPRRAAVLLAELAEAADTNRVAAGAVLRACAANHYPRD